MAGIAGMSVLQRAPHLADVADTAAFLAALHVLPPRQRAAFIARDVLGWPAADTAQLLDMSVPAANSALQRARSTMQSTLPARRVEWMAEPASGA